MTRYCVTIFLSAFLLFQVQPLIGRYILPWFGGSPSVWTTCMLFFQSLLLIGYAYVHGIVRWGTPRAQSVIHSVALLGTLFLLPITPAADWKPTELADPTWYILLLLLMCVGTPYIFLSATTPLIQSWFSRTHLKSSPYRLYALSNVGSLLGLLAYPMLVERFMPLESQAVLWSGLYALFVTLCVVSSLQLFKLSPQDEKPQDGAVASAPQVPDMEQSQTSDCVMPFSPGAVLLWLSLACCGSVLLLATTNVLCRDVASVPFLWVLPLALYLITFIVCFDREHWYKRDLFGILLIASAIALIALPYFQITLSLWLQVAQYCFTLTVCCFICHGELARHKPPVRYLTHFYLAVSAGGALGGILVTLVAPVVFSDYHEFRIAICACVMLLLLMYRLDRWKGMEPARLRREVRKTIVVAILFVVCAPLAWVFSPKTPTGNNGQIIAQKRNFYGSLKVYSQYADSPENKLFAMSHGTTMHGYQFQAEQKRQVPTSYYARESGIGLAVANHPQYLGDQGPIRIGVVGLGTGTLACYARRGDYLRFYEIDPMVIELSEQHFTFQEDARQRGADVDTYLGDARIVMDRQLARDEPEQFDVLAVDAFSSDSIPVHLLTRECFDVYRQHTKPDGIIAFHVSNRHLDLSPVVRKLADLNDMQALQVRLRPAPSDDSTSPNPASKSDWILVTKNDQFIENPLIQESYKPWGQDAKPLLLWTDDFSNLLQVLGK